jgi:MazG family protein
MSTPIDELRKIVARLRAPDGCPWDREQTHASLRGDMIEEAYETVEAIEAGGDPHLCEELGDLLLQVVMHSQIAAETGRFTFDDVATGIGTKLIRRHPHVFGDSEAKTTEAVLSQWDAIKRAEKGNKQESLLDGVSSALPALLHAEKITKRAARVGFDWENPIQVAGKIREELAETEEAITLGDPEKIEEEMGDLLFSVVNFSRKLKVEPEVALRRATGKFTRRFHALETALKERGRKPEDCALAEMDVIWNEIKRQEREEPAVEA